MKKFVLLAALSTLFFCIDSTPVLAQQTPPEIVDVYVDCESVAFDSQGNLTIRFIAAVDENDLVGAAVYLVWSANPGTVVSQNSATRSAVITPIFDVVTVTVNAFVTGQLVDSYTKVFKMSVEMQNCSVGSL